MKPVTDPALLEELETAQPPAGRKPVTDPSVLAALDDEEPKPGHFGVSLAETMEESPLGTVARQIRAARASDPEILSRSFSRLSPAGQMEALRAHEDMGVQPVPGGILARRPIDQLQGPARDALASDWERMGAEEQAMHQQRAAAGQAADAEHQAKLAAMRQAVGPPQGILQHAQELAGAFVGSVSGDPTALVGPATVTAKGVRGLLPEAGMSAVVNVGASAPTLPVWMQGAMERRGLKPEQAMGEAGASTAFAAVFGAGVPVVGRIAGKVGAKLGKAPEAVTIADVAAHAEDPQIAPDVQEFITATGYTGDPAKAAAVLDRRRTMEAGRVLQEPGQLAPRTRPDGARRAIDNEIEALRREQEGVELGEIDPAAANLPRRQPSPEVISVAPEGQARVGRPEEDHIAESIRTEERRRLEDALARAGVDMTIVKRAFDAADLQARRGHVDASGPTERDLVQQGRSEQRARGAFRLAERSREVKAANEVAQPPQGVMDVKPGGVPAGRQNRLIVDVADGRPVKVLGQDAKGMFDVVEIDPRIGQEIGQPPFKAKAIKQVEYGGRLDQDFEGRSDTQGMAEKLRLPRTTERIGVQRPLEPQRDLLDPPPAPRAPAMPQEPNQPIMRPQAMSQPISPRAEMPAPEIRPQAEIDEGSIRNPTPQDVLQNVGRKPGGKPYGIVDELKAAGGLNRAAATAEWGKSGLVQGAWDQGGRNALLQGRGMKLDRAVEWATERGYLPEGSTPNDLLEVLERNDMLPEQSQLRSEQDQWTEARDYFVEEFRERQRRGETPAQIRASWAQEAEQLAQRAGVEDELFGGRADYDNDALAREPAPDRGEAAFGEDPPFDTPVAEGARGADPFDRAPRSDAIEPVERRAPTVEKTEQGDQFVMPGAEAGPLIADPKLRAKVEQSGIDGLELFDPDASKVRQNSIFDLLANEDGAMDIARVAGDLFDFRDVAGLAKAMTAGAGIRNQWRSFSNLFMSTDAQLRALSRRYKSDALWKLADMFHSTAGMKHGWRGDKGGTVGRTYHEAVHQETGIRLSKLADLMKNFEREEGADAKIWKYITDPKSNKGQDKHAKAAKVLTDMFADLWEYRANAGEEIGKVPSGYFPRVPDLDAVRANPEGFKVAAAKVYSSVGAKDPRASAEAWYNQILTEGLGLDHMELKDVSPFAVANAAGRSREFGAIADKVLADYYLKDMVPMVSAYITGSVRRAEFTRRFGVKGRVGSAERKGWVKDHGNKTQWEVMREAIVADAKASGQDPEALTSNLGLLVRANLGTLGSNVNRGARKIVSFMHVGTQLGTLDRALGASLTELAAGAMRTGSVRQGAAFFGKSLVEFARAVKHADPSEAREWAQALGIVNDAIIEMMAQSRISGLLDSKWHQKVLAGFHKATGLHHFTEGTRVAALSAGKGFIKHWAEQAVTAQGKKRQRAEFYLKELGIEDPQAFAKWLKAQGGVPKLGDVMAGKDMAGLYRTALGRFVDQTIMNPTRATKPAFASHPVGSLFYSLMSWMFAFRNNGIGRMARLVGEGARSGDMTFMAPAVFGLPAIAAMGVLYNDVIWPKLAGKEAPEDETETQHMLRILDRSGLVSTFSPLLNIIRGTKYRRSATDVLAGASVGRVTDLATSYAALAGEGNSPNTSTAERAAIRKTYQVIVEPFIDAFASVGPRGLRTPLVMGTGRKTDEDAFVEAVADTIGLEGPEKEGGRGRRARQTRATR
jgi:hypothetical protein